MKAFDDLVRWGLNRLSPAQWYQGIAWLGRLRKIDYRKHYYDHIGVMKASTLSITGEDYLVHEILPTIFKDSAEVQIFDVGANIGEFSTLLHQQFPSSNIHAFEPVRKTRDQLVENLSDLPVSIHSIALGDQNGETDIHVATDDTYHAFSSLYVEVSNLHNMSDFEKERIQIQTLDHFCEHADIPYIHFLKIDTEGHELQVLQGAKHLLQKKACPAILFEFNEMNVLSRVFLRDFYQLLPDHAFFRLDTGKLIPLGDYKPRNEIFQFHNIFALDKELARTLTT